MWQNPIWTWHTFILICVRSISSDYRYALSGAWFIKLRWIQSSHDVQFYRDFPSMPIDVRHTHHFLTCLKITKVCGFRGVFRCTSLIQVIRAFSWGAVVCRHMSRCQDSSLLGFWAIIHLLAEQLQILLNYDQDVKHWGTPGCSEVVEWNWLPSCIAKFSHSCWLCNKPVTFPLPLPKSNNFMRLSTLSFVNTNLVCPYLFSLGHYRSKWSHRSTDPWLIIRKRPRVSAAHKRHHRISFPCTRLSASG